MLGSLLHHLWLRRIRSPQIGSGLGSSFIVLLFVAYVGFGLLGIAIAFPKFAANVAPGVAYDVLVDRWLLTAAGVYALVRFFLQRSPEAEATPYRALPIRQRTLIGVVHLDALLSWMNVLPFAFLGPYAWLHLPVETGASMALWMAGVALVVLASHAAGLSLRLLVDRGLVLFFGVVGTIVILATLDATVGPRLLPRLSRHLFDGLRAGGAAPLVPLGAMAAGLGLVLHGGLRRTLHRMADRSERGGPDTLYAPGRRFRAWVDAQLSGRGRLAQYVLLEWRLVSRSKRPRQMHGVGIVLGFGYVVIMTIVSPQDLGGGIDGLIVLMGIGLGMLNHGTYLFAWHARHFDTVLARVDDLHLWTVAQTVFLQGLCVVPTLILFPLLVVRAPHLLPVLGAVFIYCVGAVCPLLVALGTMNRKGLDLHVSTWFNYQGVQASQFAAALVILAPLMAVYGGIESPWDHLLTVGTGLLGLVTVPWWSRALGRRLHRVRHGMAVGFRGD